MVCGRISLPDVAPCPPPSEGVAGRSRGEVTNKTPTDPRLACRLHCTWALDCTGGGGPLLESRGHLNLGVTPYRRPCPRPLTPSFIYSTPPNLPGRVTHLF